MPLCYVSSSYKTVKVCTKVNDIHLMFLDGMGMQTACTLSKLEVTQSVIHKDMLVPTSDNNLSNTAAYQDKFE